ncbi:MAG TPA: GNAT family N-acetyltransferase [Anaerolineales bacterium]|nr:GNAT family N-acetyltransferase [Anaerolineales bacterium]
MEFSTIPASNYSLSELVPLLNRGFEGYVIPIHFTMDMFANMLRKDGIDLAESRVLLADDQACGVALIAPRRSIQTSRVAAMGIARETRGKGTGSWLMKRLIEDARKRGDREMVLEVIEHNKPAVRLYQNYGFESMRRLVGFTRSASDSGKPDKENGEKPLHNVDLHEMGRLISRHGLPDLPWQLSGESISQANPTLHAFRDGPAYVVISNPEAEHVVIWSLLVEPKARGHGLGTKLLQRVTALHIGKAWHVPAILPEELGSVFERAGFEKEKLTQWQMKLSL